MADRTYLELTVYDCPDEEAGAVLDVIDEFGLSPESGDVVGGRLKLGMVYVGEEVVCWSAGAIARALCATAPNSAWEVWEAPKYHWLGELYRYTPELDLFTRHCDADGEPVFYPHDVLNLHDSTITSQSLREFVGDVHIARMDELFDINRDVHRPRPAPSIAR